MCLGRADPLARPGGVESAPRGIPQVEMSFDIDADSFVNVSAKDLGMGMQQSVQIADGSVAVRLDLRRHLGAD